MTARRYSLNDRFLGEIDHALRTIAARPRAARPLPEPTETQAHTELQAAERREAARLMRVNHAGEIAAQALYRGQALVTRDPELREHLLAAADEEHDHLAWCRERAESLGGGVSVLTPLWYAGSFAIGTAAGLAGDKQSLGFLAETERQVEAHLDGHLEKLPAGDSTSRHILETMRDDEVRHADEAIEKGGSALPEPVKKAMRLTSKVMTGLAYRL